MLLLIYFLILLLYALNGHTMQDKFAKGHGPTRLICQMHQSEILKFCLIVTVSIGASRLQILLPYAKLSEHHKKMKVSEALHLTFVYHSVQYKRGHRDMRNIDY